MRITQRAVATALLLGGLAFGGTRVEAMPVGALAAPVASQTEIQPVYYGYGWRRPFFRRRFYGYGYGWRRPYFARGYGPGYRRGWHNRRLLGSRAR